MAGLNQNTEYNAEVNTSVTSNNVDDRMESAAIAEEQNDVGETFETRMIHSGFRTLQKEMQDVKKKMDEVLQNTESGSEEKWSGILIRIEKLEKEASEKAESGENAATKKRIEDLESKVSEIMKDKLKEKRRNTVLTGTISYMSQVIGDLTKKVDSLELTNTKR